MSSAARARPAGTVLFVTMMTLAALSVLAAFTLQRISPKFPMAHQNAAWQESRLAAEAGVDAAMGDLLRNATGTSAGEWSGWKQQAPGGSGIIPALPGTVNLVSTVLSLLGVSVSSSSQPIFLDNVKIASATGIPTEVDVQLWGLHPKTNPRTLWFRIRSMATCALPRAARQAPLSLDVPLRRFSLRQVRPQLRKDDVGQRSTIPPPSVARIIEVLVEPVPPFELALWTDHSLSLGGNGAWDVDSYDSSDPQKANADGTYPGRGSAKVQENGNIANNRNRPAGSLYGALISANGARVHGVVATNGGDDPDTITHENVTGDANVDSARVRDDFWRQMKPLARPTPGWVLPPPALGQPFEPGTESVPTYYRVNGNLGAFSVAPSSDTTPGAIVIMVNGDLDVSAGTITIPPNVTAQLYVRGNIDFHDQDINAGSTSSRRAAQLQIYGEDSGHETRTLRASGDSAIYAAFYGPTCDVRIGGHVSWFGAIAAHAFETSGGGSGGLHYDEALGSVGPPISFRIARYVEDVRE